MHPLRLRGVQLHGLLLERYSRYVPEQNKLPLLQRSIGLETVRLGYVPGQLMLTTEDNHSRVIVMIAFLTPFADSGIGFAFGYVL